MTVSKKLSFGEWVLGLFAMIAMGFGLAWVLAKLLNHTSQTTDEVMPALFDFFEGFMILVGFCVLGFFLLLFLPTWVLSEVFGEWVVAVVAILVVGGFVGVLIWGFVTLRREDEAARKSLDRQQKAVDKFHRYVRRRDRSG